MKNPLIVPIAMPYVAGPGVLAYIALHSENTWLAIGAIFFAWSLSLLVVIVAFKFKRFFSESALEALERFMGFILAIISVEMIIKGIMSLL